jgi:hypothetical protein
LIGIAGPSNTGPLPIMMRGVVGPANTGVPPATIKTPCRAIVRPFPMQLMIVASVPGSNSLTAHAGAPAGRAGSRTKVADLMDAVRRPLGKYNALQLKLLAEHQRLQTALAKTIVSGEF